ncbi:hypothetical protein [Cellulomonas uda]|uniref:Uncharacterized protein n=1 Tax=Cellulomonas uda TaxID=1714 RepID=A0A4Y3KAV0_CELUD|nr:hypothetical protein [Cellulomonas uda]NII67793.1 hypothetical protein [Cellulomonas uda]GEA79960.1 hypothetical protein CUD01_04040 [Cellulomonas uda]
MSSTTPTVATLVANPGSTQLRLLVARVAKRLERGDSIETVTAWVGSRGARLVFGSSAQRIVLTLIGGAR